MTMMTKTMGLAMAVADVPIALSIPGEILDSLVGPWIEAVGTDLFRVSPLVAGSAPILHELDGWGFPTSPAP